MNFARLPELCLRLGIIYLVIGMSLGAFMGMSGRFELHDLHAHINLLGYASTFLVGLFLKAYPAGTKSRLLRGSVLVILAAVPLTLVFLALYSLGHAKFEPALGMASWAVLLGYALFAISVFRITNKK
ncbi:MAG: hypothetical protein AB7H77_04355 [Bdellovibrionales bacterium]